MAENLTQFTLTVTSADHLVTSWWQNERRRATTDHCNCQS